LTSLIEEDYALQDRRTKQENKVAILVECSSCHYKNPEKNTKCKKCGAELKPKIYWIDYYFEGRRIREKVGPWRRLALEALAKRKVEIAENKFLDKRKEPPKIKFKDFAKEYDKWCQINNKGYAKKKTYINHLAEVFGDKYLSEITTWVIEKYKIERKKQNRKSTNTPIKHSTVNRELATLKHMFSKAIEWGFIKENPAKPVKLFKENNRRLRFLSEEEINKLLSACHGYLKDIVIVALNTGMRRGEIFNLKWQDIDFELKLIHVADSKNNESRDIPMNETLYKTLKALKDKAEPGQQYVFINPRTSKPYDDVKTSFKSALKRAAIENFTFHDLRHTFASHLVMNGVDLMTVKELLGHKDIKMTMRYSHLSPDHKRVAVKRLDRLFDHIAQAQIIHPQTHP